MSLKNKIYLSDGHDLVLTSNREEGNMGQEQHFYYDEIDETGCVVANYEYWDCTTSMPPFSTSTGYRKLDLDGNKIEEVEF